MCRSHTLKTNNAERILTPQQKDASRPRTDSREQAMPLPQPLHHAIPQNPTGIFLKTGKTILSLSGMWQIWNNQTTERKDEVVKADTTWLPCLPQTCGDHCGCGTGAQLHTDVSRNRPCEGYAEEKEPHLYSLKRCQREREGGRKGGEGKRKREGRKEKRKQNTTQSTLGTKTRKPSHSDGQGRGITNWRTASET